MKSIKLILSITITTLLLTACNKETVEKDGEKCGNNECTFSSPIPSFGNVLTQSKQDEYHGIWKAILMDKSNMSASYFDTHIIDHKISSSEWNAGTSFEINYIMRIDWMTINCSDKFLVKMNSSYEAYGYMNIPRDVYFDQPRIESNIDAKVNSEISSYNLLEQLKYSNCSDLKTAIKDSSGYDVAKPANATYYVPGKIPREDGDPYVLIKGTVNQQENKCLNGQINLNTGECNVCEDACGVN